ncbi:MAG: hypothetical protein RLZZ34_520, partial [Verrucomicrobiota bacterium]
MNASLPSLRVPGSPLGSNPRSRRAAALAGVGLAMILGALVVRAHDWPEFRGPTGQGISPAKNVPIRWSGTENVAWKMALPVAGWSSPVLVKQRLYLSGARPVAGGSK